MNRVTPADRQAAAESQAAARAAIALKTKRTSSPAAKGAKSSTFSTQAAQMAMTMPMPGGTPDYFGVANWANSPPLRKFVDSLPGLGADANNNLGQYIPVAVADVNAYPGSDYYEIGLVQYTEKMHSDLPPTTLRGYVQLETAANAGISKHIALKYPNGNPILNAQGAQVLAVDKPHYMGPTIIAQKNRPTRIKFY